MFGSVHWFPSAVSVTLGGNAVAYVMPQHGASRGALLSGGRLQAIE